MEGIKHSMIETNGITMHVASIGATTGPAILFLHGFPELWYSWRRHMASLSALGFRCVAPDLRGYGDSDAPPSPESYTALSVVGDLVGLMDGLGIDRTFVVGHDWGAIMAWYLCLFRPDRVVALVNMSVAFPVRNPKCKPIHGFRALLGDDYYICRFQDPGEAEKDFAGDDTANLLKKFYAGRNPRPPCIKKEIGFRGLKTPQALPSWLSQQDLDFYAKKFNKTGFSGGLNYYRALDLTWEQTAAWTGAQVKVPVKFIIGDLDVTYHVPGAKEFIHGDGFKKFVPYLQELVVMEGVAHFINQEKAEETTSHIYDFFKKF